MTVKESWAKRMAEYVNNPINEEEVYGLFNRDLLKEMEEYVPKAFEESRIRRIFNKCLTHYHYEWARLIIEKYGTPVIKDDMIIAAGWANY